MELDEKKRVSRFYLGICLLASMVLARSVQERKGEVTDAEKAHEFDLIVQMVNDRATRKNGTQTQPEDIANEVNRLINLDQAGPHGW